MLTKHVSSVNRLLIDTQAIFQARDYPAGLWVSGVEVRSLTLPRTLYSCLVVHNGR